jgi:hypothetical protein
LNGEFILRTKDYGEEIVRILNIWQVTLYISNNVKPIDEYVSKDSKGNYVIVFVFSKKDSQDVFIKFRNHELELGDVHETTL